MASSAPNLRAALYLRMSTETQDLSLEFQRATNVAYALEHGYEIVRTYTDAGISGLTLNRREGLKGLLADVLGGAADYSIVLVYDVSRWGRFQNPDQAAHYEFVCSEAGVRVAYCAEPFDNDGSPTSALIKHVKRAMAAEYSRDLARKVTLGRRTSAAQGFWVGGAPPYGYRREVFDREGRVSEVADMMFWQKRQGVHSRLVLGPEREVKTVRRVFRLFLKPGATIGEVAKTLNARGSVGSTGRPWSSQSIGYLLRNEAYIGRLVYRHVMAGVGNSRKLLLPREDWVVAENAAPVIVSSRMFKAAQTKRARQAAPITDAELFEDACRVAKEHGTLSARLLRQHGRWGDLIYQRRFGGMQRLRNLIGVAPAPAHRRMDIVRDNARRRRGYPQLDGRLRLLLYTNDEIVELVGRLLAETGFLSSAAIDRAVDLPTAQTCRRRFGDLGELYRRVGYQPKPGQIRSGRARWARPWPG